MTYLFNHVNNVELAMLKIYECFTFTLAHETNTLMRKHIFNAGPSVLPLEVLENASKAASELNDLGLSILEISHRGIEFSEILNEAKRLIRSIYSLSDEFEILFLQGGASTQFCMIPFNFLDKHKKAIYIDTGEWSSKAIKEAQHFGDVQVVASSKDSRYNYIPKDFIIPSNANYLHLTSNNTIYGTQFHKFPKSPIPTITDMSSDIFSREIDLSQFELIYAGAQKNLGPAGVTLVLIKKEMLARIDMNKKIPSMMDYRVHVSKGSLYNTPPVFNIYVCLLTLKWINEQGGLMGIGIQNKAKADLLYRTIDNYPLFIGTAEKSDRSSMNVTFNLNDPRLENKFVELTNEANIIGLRGHRLVGGFRASIYNALPMKSVELLTDVMIHFAEKHG